MIRHFFSFMLLCIFLCPVLPVAYSMGGGGSFQYKGKIKNGSWLRDCKAEYDFNGIKGFVNVHLYFPKSYVKGEKSRTVVLLHAYKGSCRDWAKETSVERMADLYRTVLVCPDMDDSVYASGFYPETSRVWAGIPGGLFIGDVLIPWLQNNFRLATSEDITAIAGVGIGGRGALLSAARYNNLFKVAVGLSGAYDMKTMTRSSAFKSVYGDYKDFKSRWEKDDNLIEMAESLKGTYIYLWHGGKDFSISRNNSLILAIRLRQLQKESGGYYIEYHEDKHYHGGWQYWRRALPEAFSFIDANLDKV